MDSKTKMVAALGRPFGLGMLYDCRQDLLLPGVTLWGRENLENFIRVRPKAYNDFQILASESISDKVSALNVEASLQASFFSGLVEVGGSAKYLNDQKTSQNQARVTLKYEATTNFQELSMEHLGRGNVKYPYVFDQGLATHVVTGILYGAQAFLVFDSDVSEGENQQDIEGSLHVMIKKIPSIVIEGSGGVKLSDEDKATVKKFSCKFHGDFLLQKTPTTFQDAVEIYQNLPTLLGQNGENAKPMKVWLFPLSNLDSKAAQMVREISATFVEQAQNVLQDLGEAEIRCNDVLKTLAQRFSAITNKLRNFKETCNAFKLEFQCQLAQILPNIRGGGEEEAKLGEILEKRISSPFNNTRLNQWMDVKEREVDTVTFFTNLMQNTKTAPTQMDLYKEVLSVENAVCFIFTSLESEEPYLSALVKYLKEPDDQDFSTKDLETEQWFTSKDLMDDTRRKAKLFMDFAEANEQNSKLKFLVAGLKDESHKGSTIYLYKDGFTVSEDFVPPSKPESVTVQDVDHNALVLKISAPRFGAENVSSYSVEFCPKGEDEWKQKTGPTSGEVTVSDLKPNTEYLFRCRAATSLGLGPAYDPIDPIRTLPCSPPRGLHAEKDVCELSVSWEQPAVIGPGVQILGYTVEYTVSKPDTSDLLWKQIKSSSQGVTISGLQSDTEYAVRIRCDCGESGMSKESPTVVWRTPDTYQLLLQELLQDFPDLDTKLENVLHSTTVQNFPLIAAQLKTFRLLTGEFRLVFLDKLKSRFSSFLNQEEKKHAITEMLKLRNQTPFSQASLSEWMQIKTSEVTSRFSTTSAMRNTEIVPSSEVYEQKIRSAKNVMAFVFTSFTDSNNFLEAFSEYVNGKEVNNQSLRPSKMLLPPSQHLDRVKLFIDFTEANEQQGDLKFLVAGLTDETHKGSTIYLYKDGFTVSEDFIPPSKPGSVTVRDVDQGTAILKISAPKFGAENVSSYSVVFCPKGEVGWKQETAPISGEVTVSNLKPNTEYLFRCRAVTSVGVGPFQETYFTHQGFWTSSFKFVHLNQHETKKRPHDHRCF